MYWAPCLEFTNELTFPVGEASSNGLLTLGGFLTKIFFFTIKIFFQYILGTVYAIVFGFVFTIIFKVFDKSMWSKICFPIFLL